MKSYRRQQPATGRVALACALAGSVTLTAQAQQRDNSSVAALEEIIVTATKRAERLQDVPVSVKALDSATLEQVNADGLEDVARMVPSLSMTNLSRGGNQVQIRGLGSNVASVGTVAIYNDGIISASRIQSSGTFSERDSVLYDIERVEVLRGPQGTLYGEGSFGGVINVISKRPNKDQLEASFGATRYDVDEGSSDNTDLQGMINLPLVKDVFAVRAVGYRLDHDGYIDAVNVLPVLFGGPPELVKEDANTEEITGGRVLAGLSLGDSFEATAIFKTEKVEQGINSTVSPHLIGLINSLVGTTYNPKFTQAVFDSAIGSETKFDEGVLDLSIDTPLGKLTSISGWGKIDQDAASTVTADSKAFSEELRLSSDQERTLSWTTGAYYRDADRDIDLGALPIVANKVKQWSVFGQAYWRFAPRWQATLGLRYEEQDIDVTDELNGLPTVNGKFDSVIPKLSVDYKVSEDALLYASAAKGFRAGGANADQSLGTDPDYVQAFDPDQIWNYEIGSKTTFLDNRVTVNAAIFYIDWSDIQIDRAITSLVPGTTTQFIVVNGADAHSYGIEADLYIRPTPDWDITLGGSWLEAQYDGGTIDSATIGENVPIDGMTLPSTPEYLFNASLERRFTFGSVDAYGRADYSLRGSSFGDVPNTPPPGGDLSSGVSRSLDLRAGVRGKNWEVQLFATNVTNEYNGTYTFYDGGFADLNAVLRPRTIGINLKLRYD